MTDEKKKELAKVLAGRMATNARQIDALRSTKGQIKGALTRDTLYRLRQAVADHKKAGEPGAEARLGIILGLCDSYIERHDAEIDDRAREKVEFVEDVKAEALAERSRRQAEGIYIRDVYAGARRAPGVTTHTKFVRETAGTIATATYQTQELAAGKTDKDEKEGFNQVTLDLIKKYGLNEAEVLAVKVYTADDYKYINPAMAQDVSRMKTYMNPPRERKPDDSDLSESSDSDLADQMSLPDQELSKVLESIQQAEEELANLLAEDAGLRDSKGKEPEYKYAKRMKLGDSNGEEPDVRMISPPDDQLTEKELSHLQQLFEEGSLHGAMAVAALKKLPAREGLCYRGMRMTEKDFRERFEQATIQPETLRQLTSVATERDAAQPFADGEGCRDPNKKVSVLTCVHVHTGRDIGDLSVHGRKEKEWLLLPGTVLQVDSVEDVPDGNPGKPKANRWVVIQSHEV